MYKLRELKREDILNINIWRANKDLIDCLGANFRFINLEVDNNWFDNYMLNRESNIRCSILSKNDDAIGIVSLTNIDRVNQRAVFHIMIGDTNNRGKGAGFFATNEMIKHAFLDMNLNRIELTVLETNKSAICLYEKIGFKKEGIKRNCVFKNGKFVNMILMSILKEEFIK